LVERFGNQGKKAAESVEAVRLPARARSSHDPIGLRFLPASRLDLVRFARLAVNGKVSGARFSDDKPVAILVHGPTNCDGSSWVASPPGIPVSGQDRLSVAVLQSDAVRGCLARLPQTAMLHHRLARLREWSANTNVQACPSHALIGEIFLAHELGQRFADRQQEDSRERQRRIFRTSRRSPLLSRCRDIWQNASSRSKSLFSGPNS